MLLAFSFIIKPFARSNLFKWKQYYHYFSELSKWQCILNGQTQPEYESVCEPHQETIANVKPRVLVKHIKAAKGSFIVIGDHRQCRLLMTNPMLLMPSQFLSSNLSTIWEFLLLANVRSTHFVISRVAQVLGLRKYTLVDDPTEVKSLACYTLCRSRSELWSMRSMP